MQGWQRNQGAWLAGRTHTRQADNVFASRVDNEASRVTSEVKMIVAVQAGHYSEIANKRVSLAASALLLLP